MMGWDINVFSMDFDRLRRVVGCRDGRLYERLVSAYALDDEEDIDPDELDEDEEPPLPLKDALRNILLGTLAEDRAEEQAYSDAMGILFEALSAGHVGDLRVASFGITSFFREVDAVLLQRGFPGYMSQLVLGGSPVPVPIGPDGALGFVLPAECERFSHEYSRHDWSNVARPLQQTVTDLCGWCSEAAKNGHGLVAKGG
jgi:hypothetical protein